MLGWFTIRRFHLAYISQQEIVRNPDTNCIILKSFLCIYLLKQAVVTLINALAPVTNPLMYGEMET